VYFHSIVLAPHVGVQPALRLVKPCAQVGILGAQIGVLARQAVRGLF